MAEKKTAAKKTSRPRSTQKYVRNIRNAPGSIRLADGTRLELKPRGYRGDSMPVTATQLKDPTLLDNVGLLIEVLTATEYNKVVAKQTNNQQAAHPALAMLLNPEKDNQPYENPEVRVVDEQGRRITVGTFDTHDPDQSARRQTFVQRADGSAPPQDNAAGSTGNPVQIGSAAEEQALMQADAAARTNLEGPKAGLQGFTFRD